MSRNVEIKAKVQDHDEVVRKAAEISGQKPTILKQHDIFYQSPNGRLKMRSVEENGQTTLAKSMGLKGEVKKVRTLVLHGQTRIHIDRVEGLGDFMELEVCLSPSDTVESGESIAQSIRQQLGIPESDLLTGAYMDMLKQ